MNDYDSSVDTMIHSNTVRNLMVDIANKLNERGASHDRSKLHPPEKRIFDEFIPKLKDVKYGSDEYAGYLAGMNVALKHHYENNRHHPEHFKDGVSGMTLIDIVEMLCDWKAASMRHTKDGNFGDSLNHNRKRFDVSDQLQAIFINTAIEFGWLQDDGDTGE